MESPNPQMDKSLEETPKKCPFVDLSKEELVKKCKGFLSIAQKAKQAKTELASEFATVKERCKQLETQKLADKECLKTMQEFVDTLTEQKLDYTTEIDSLKKINSQQKAVLKQKQDEMDAIIVSNEEQLKSLKEDFSKMESNLSNMDTDVTSLKRQNVRLEKDNENLINQLDQLEKEIETLNRLGLEQRSQLLELEHNSKGSDVGAQDSSQFLVNSEQMAIELESYKQSVQQITEEKTEMSNNIGKLKATIDEKSTQFSQMEIEMEKMKSLLNEKSQDLSEADAKLAEKTKTLEETLKLYDLDKVKKDKLNAKLKLYKEKIIKCSSSITQLKNSKFILLKTVSEYSESVPKWQSDILNASKLLSEQLLTLENENNQLKERLANLDSHPVENNQEEIDNLKADRDAIKSQLQSTIEQMREVEIKHVQLIDDLRVYQVAKEAQLQITEALESEKLILINEKQGARDLIQKNESEIAGLQNICQDLNSNISTLKSQLCSANKRANSLEEEKQTIAKELDVFKSDRADSEDALISSLNNELSSLKISLVSVEEQNELLREANNMLKTKVETLTTSLDEPNPEMYSVVEHNNMLQADISKLEAKMGAYKSENSSLLQEMKESRIRLADLESKLQELAEAKAKLNNFKSENIELLNEMKEINQVLKERGETISKQDMEISEFNRRIKVLEQEVKKAKEESDSKDEEMKRMEDRLHEKESRLKLVDSGSEEKLHALKAAKEDLEALLKERDSIIIALNEDIERLKSSQGNFTSDAPSESMSISTVSRVEETSRLKDLDESFEDRYAKLRLLALKLKKRVGELTIQLKLSEEEKSKFEQEKKELTTKMELSGSTSKNIQSIQAEYDKAIDKLEQKDLDIKNNDKVCQNLKSTIEKLNDDLTACNERANKLVTDLDIAKKEKTVLDMVVKELQSQIAKLNKDGESFKAKDADILQLKADLAAKESQLSVEVTSHQSTREALERARRDVKKKSVLSLEMDDYERSMKELTTKMEDNKKKIVQMESTIDTQEATITSLRTQIKMLEEQLATEEKITRETKDLYNMAADNLKDKETTIISKVEFISELEMKLEEANLHSEDLNIQLASALGEKEKSALSMGHEKLEFIAKLKRAENRCSEMEEKLRVKSIELEDLKTEFAGYKVRAQSVLRQNQTKDLSLEENLKEEMATLKAELEALRPELHSTKEELEAVSAERSRLATRCTDLQTAVQNEREAAANQAQREQQEQKNIKLQMTTLTQCYKKQISDLEERTSDEISNLRKELDYSKASLEQAIALSKENSHSISGHASLEKKRSPQQFVAIGSNSSNNNNRENDNGSNDSHDSMEISSALPQREEGEGSESTPSPSPTYVSRTSGQGKAPSSRGRREPVPLEQLLGEDIPEHGTEEGDLEHRLEVALRQIEMQDKRLAHMTDIVAEAEREVARRAQLGEVLKEEIRRCQRAQDRSQHQHNQEYLKNVIIKFLTLGAGDERCRLVPVLHTILTLSPDEKQALTAVAKGTDPNSSRGWDSYLPWSGKS